MVGCHRTKRPGGVDERKRRPEYHDGPVVATMFNTNIHDLDVLQLHDSDRPSGEFGSSSGTIQERYLRVGEQYGQWDAGQPDTRSDVHDTSGVHHTGR